MKKFFFVLFELFLSFISLSQPCLPEGIIFTRQSQIDSFPINFPNCNEIVGDLQIGNYPGSTIYNLQGLIGIASIGGELYINFVSNPINLSGLSNLTSVGGDLILQSLDSLTSVTGLEKLTTVGKNLILVDNPVLNNLEGINNLITIGSYLQIDRNHSLKDVSGLNNLTSAGGVQIFGNDSLNTITGLNGLQSIGACLIIDYNNSLVEVSGLNGLSSVGNYIWVKLNPALKRITGLESLYSTGGFFGFQDNPRLTDLSGLGSVVSVGGSFFISGTDSLTSLTGLKNITIISGNLSLFGNKALSSLLGLEKVNPTFLKILFISNNEVLSDCAIESICNYLKNPNDTIIIKDNSIGCESLEELKSVCDTLSIEIVPDLERIEVYPNPAFDKLTVETKRILVEGKGSIVDLSGKLLYSKMLHGLKTEIDLRFLNSGIYFLKINDRLSIRNLKFIKL
jgi:hypothetical protein